jgi:hypothetical protein
MNSENRNDKSIESYQEFLTAEFHYIAQTAFQAQEDRARVSEFFLISIGSLVAAIISSQIDQLDIIMLTRWLVAIFGVVAVLGMLTVLHLARLRAAWLESVRAMNSMKDAVMQECPALVDCFCWQTSTIPSSFKAWSVGFLLALEVSILSGVVIGAAVFAGATASGVEISMPWLMGIVLFSVCGYMLFFYYLPLKGKPLSR